VIVTPAALDFDTITRFDTLLFRVDEVEDIKLKMPEDREATLTKTFVHIAKHELTQKHKPEPTQSADHQIALLNRKVSSLTAAVVLIGAVLLFKAFF